MRPPSKTTLFVTLALLLAAPALAHAQAVVAIALQGESAPDSGGGSFGIFAIPPAINDLAQVVFRTTITGGMAAEGIYLDAGQGLVTVAVSGDPAPDTGGGVFDTFGAPAINAAGQIAFRASVTGGTAATGIFLYTGGDIEAIILSLSPAPGTDGGSFSTFATNVALSDAGEVAFVANVSNSTTTTGIWADAGAGPRDVFLTSKPTPAELPGTYFNFSNPTINASGEVFAAASIQATAGGFTSAMVVESAGVDAIVARVGDAAPDVGPGTYSEFNFLAAPAIDNAGRLFFHARIAGGTASQGIFVDDDGLQAAVALQGDEAPGILGADYFAFSTSRLFANAGRVGWSSSLQGGPSPQGLFFGSAADDHELIARFGETAPDTAGGTYLILANNPSVNAGGGVAFQANLSGGSAASGIFAVPVPAPEPSAAACGLAAALSLALIVRSRGRAGRERLAQ